MKEQKNNKRCYGALESLDRAHRTNYTISKENAVNDYGDVRTCRGESVFYTGPCGTKEKICGCCGSEEVENYCHGPAVRENTCGDHSETVYRTVVHAVKLRGCDYMRDAAGRRQEENKAKPCVCCEDEAEKESICSHETAKISECSEEKPKCPDPARWPVYRVISNDTPDCGCHEDASVYRAPRGVKREVDEADACGKDTENCARYAMCPEGLVIEEAGKYVVIYSLDEGYSGADNCLALSGRRLLCPLSGSTGEGQAVFDAEAGDILTVADAEGATVRIMRIG